MGCIKRLTGAARHVALLSSLTVFVITFPAAAQRLEPLVIDHTCADVTRIPETAIYQAISDLHIAFGRTSHGRQISNGMADLVAFANGGGLGLAHPDDIFAWSHDGTGKTLHFDDGAMSGDAGYYPDWVDNTVAYLGPPDPTTGRGTLRPQINVVMWAWCDQVGRRYQDGLLHSEYLIPMSQLESDYPGVTFVYMTGPMDYDWDEKIKLGNQVIRDYCVANNKVLFDFGDIECYDPDGTYYEFPDDNCDYYATVEGPLLGNWGVEWQNTHTEGVDWYLSDAPHSEPVNGNRKAYAAWWLFAKLAGWENATGARDEGVLPANFELSQNVPNPFNPITKISFRIPGQSRVVLTVYDVLGREVRNLLDETRSEGIHDVYWDGRDNAGRRVGSGLYLYRLQSGTNIQTKKMMLLQ
jgi:hypothetical protein